MEKTYNKLIRDKIPEIIESSGKEYVVEVLSDDECIQQLKVKLREELEEYMTATEDEEVTELADLVEVVYALLKHKNVSIEEFEKIRIQKQKDRGAFDKKLFLKTVSE